MADIQTEQYEKLGAFYLGRPIDGPNGDPAGPPVLYDAKDLTTHGVIVGMTGSGKTGLAVGILEEAALDGVPAIAVDLKGDLTNLMLAFPDLLPEDFRPWIDPSAAARKGQSADDFAASTADLWRNGLASWGQDGARIRRYRDAAEIRILTPGSTRGAPVSLLGSLAPPAGGADADTIRDHVAGTVSSLLTLLGLDPDPIQSREHILLSNLLVHAFDARRHLTLADLIRLVQQPPFDSVGVIDLDTFYPPKDRMALAMTINNLLASPGFSSWREGEPLSVQSLLYGEGGKPRLSILYLAHLSDQERMFFMTRLLGEVVSWMRTQQGTSSLRALLYIDEVFGYFPPSANPPSKKPLLTLMKQARAYGLGVLLATQNPVDLDYKGLSNAGTWMLGRLQTERDKLRVLDGLDGASGGAFDRAAADTVLSGLGKRRFLLHSVHESGPTLFHTRWVMSYLAGPLTMAQVETLAEKAPQPASPPSEEAAAPAEPEGTVAVGEGRPMIPTGVDEVFLPGSRSGATYSPGLLGEVRVHYVNATWNVDTWQTLYVGGTVADEPWADASVLTEEPPMETEPWPGARFEDVPGQGLRAASYKAYSRQLKDWTYRTQPVTLYRERKLKLFSEPGESEGDFRARIRHAVREHRDVAVEELREKYEARFDRLRDRIRDAEARVEKEEAQYDQVKLSSMLDIGATLLGGVLGRRRSRVSGTTRAVRGFGRASKEKQDIAHAQEKLDDLVEDLEKLKLELDSEVDELVRTLDAETIDLEAREQAPRKSDIQVVRVALAWTPS